MSKKIKIRVFNTLESSNLMVSGWCSYKDNPNKRYGLFTGATDGLEIEREVQCKKFMKPNVKIFSTNLWQITIKIRHCDCDLIFEHEYRNWNDDICIGWLRPGNLGGETVNWFFNGKEDCWYNGGNKGDSLVVSHRVTCGNIPPSDISIDTEKEEDIGQYIKPDSGGNTSPSGGNYVRPDSGGNTSPSGGNYVRPDSGGNTSPSGGNYVRPDSGGNTSSSGGNYVRPDSGGNTSTPGRLYPTGKGSILEKYMNEDGSPKEPKRAYPTPYGTGGKSTHTPGRLYPTGKGSVLEKYMNEDGSPKEPKRAYPTPYGTGNKENNKSEEDTEGKDGPRYIRPNSTGE
ncbi:hypothetical protein I6E20_10150 [Bacteroides caecigallinarum]|nr:hypothetical protein [Bacteroides caecigallinarum]